MGIEIEHPQGAFWCGDSTYLGFQVADVSLLVKEEGGSLRLGLLVFIIISYFRHCLCHLGSVYVTEREVVLSGGVVVGVQIAGKGLGTVQTLLLLFV